MLYNQINRPHNGYDIIGDIHGHYNALFNLLLLMGYKPYNNNDNEIYFKHDSGRIPVFVGDLIDRGPQIRETVLLVKRMCDMDLALCISGNHEFNAINFWQKNDKNEYYREHSQTNIIQHYETIKAFQNREDEFKQILEWFQNLPVIMEFLKFRVVHATYHPKILDFYDELYLNNDFSNHLINKEILTLGRMNPHKTGINLKIDDYQLYDVLEIVLKGNEMKLPEGITFTDKDGKIRTKSRLKWWVSPINNTLKNCLESNATNADNFPDTPIDINLIDPVFHNGYDKNNKIVFFGHYWYNFDTSPKSILSNVACLDYSVARGGHLVAYRYDNEDILDDSKFVFVKS